jgi:hypothetical protein
MSSTIDTRRWFAVLRFCGAAGFVLGVWLAIATLAAFAEPTATVTALGPRAKLLQAVKTSDVEFVNAGPGFIIVRGRTNGFVRALYAGGAWAVLPGGIGACGAADLSGRA